MSEEPFLLALARSTPVPGGGSAAAYAASVGLALLEKIVRLEGRRARLTPEEGRVWDDLLTRVRSSAEIFDRLREEDSEAYVNLAEARRTRDKGAIRAAWEQAIECPVRIMREAHEALVIARAAGERCEEHLVADVLVVLQLLRAGARGAFHIVAANLRMAATTDAWKGDLALPGGILGHAEKAFAQAEERILSRLKGGY